MGAVPPLVTPVPSAFPAVWDHKFSRLWCSPTYLAVFVVWSEHQTHPGFALVDVTCQMKPRPDADAEVIQQVIAPALIRKRAPYPSRFIVAGQSASADSFDFTPLARVMTP